MPAVAHAWHEVAYEIMIRVALRGDLGLHGGIWVTGGEERSLRLPPPSPVS